MRKVKNTSSEWDSTDCDHCGQELVRYKGSFDLFIDRLITPGDPAKKK